MMTSMMANTDSLSDMETRKPTQQLSFHNVQFTKASPGAVCKVRQLHMAEKLT